MRVVCEEVVDLFFVKREEVLPKIFGFNPVDLVSLLVLIEGSSLDVVLAHRLSCRCLER